MRFRVLQALLVLCWVVFGTFAAKAQTPIQVAPQSWEGAFAGVQTGYRWGDVEVTGGLFGTETFSLNSALFGGHIGYNVLLNNNIIIGVVADIDALAKQSQTNFASQSIVIPQIESVPLVITRSLASTVSMDWQATLRARLGIVDGAALYYATAGIAWLDTDWTQTVSIGGAQTIVSKSQVIPGWAVGGGVATFIAENTIAWSEYLYEEFSNRTVPLATGGNGTLDASAHKLRFGVSIRF